MLAQSFEGAHKDMMCVHAFIWVSVCTRTSPLVPSMYVATGSVFALNCYGAQVAIGQCAAC